MNKELMYCNQCGKELPAGSRFCQHCGAAVAQIATGPASSPIQTSKPVISSRISRKQLLIGIIAGLVLTAICTPAVLIARRQVSFSFLNPEYRAQLIEPDSREVTNPDTSDDLTDSSTSSSQNQTNPGSSPTFTPQPPATTTPTPEGIQVSLIEGNALEFNQPPQQFVYADDQSGDIPDWIQLAPFCRAGCFRYYGWLGLVSAGDSYDVIFTEPTTSIGVQFWGDPGDGIAHVYLDGELVWEGSTEGTDANYPGGAFVNYLQISNLPLIANHILRIETDPNAGGVTMYFFGSGLALP